MKKSLSALTLMIGFILVLSGCESKKASPLLNETLQKENLVSFVEKVKDDKDMTTEEISLFATGIMRESIQDSLEGKTVADIIKFEEEQRRNNAYNLALTNATKTEMNNALSLVVDPKAHVIKKDSSGKAYDILQYTVKNNSAEKITLVRGVLTFQVGNRAIKNFTINSDKEIGPDDALKLQQIYKVDQSSINFQNLKGKKAQFIVRWQPILIDFEGDRKLELKVANR